MSIVNVDNSDTSLIEYHSTADAQWQFLVSMPDGNIYNHSLSVIWGQGSAIFRFTGSRVEVYGAEMFLQNGPVVVSNYTLDQQAPAVHISGSPSNTQQDMIEFYSSGDISVGDHVLIINVTAASTAVPYYLDFIAYSHVYTSTSSSSSSSSSTSTSNAGTTTSTTDTSLPTISATSAVEKSNNVNAIVGGVVGGAVGLIAIILAIFFFCFGRQVLQRYTARKKDLQSELPTEATDVTPYIASDLGSSPHMSEARSPTPLQIANRALSERPSLCPHEVTRSSFTLTPDDSASQAAGALTISPSGPRLSASRKSGVPPPVASEPPATHHADSGLRFRSEATPSEVAPIDVPPVYTPN